MILTKLKALMVTRGCFLYNRAVIESRDEARDLMIAFT
jgi:hypothetical protein